MPRSKGGRGKPGRTPSRPSGRQLHTKVKTAKGRKKLSVRWLQRQLNDPYVVEAARHGYRSRAAWKLAQIDDRHRILKPGQRVIDLGAAPGGWTQVAVERARPADGGCVIAVDLVEMDPVPEAGTLTLDVHDEDSAARLTAALGGPADVLLSDMAAPATGHRGTDRVRAEGLCEIAHALAREVLAPGGALVMKAFHGGGEAALMTALKQDFARVRTAKPEASRADSAETYIIATGFRGTDSAP